MEKIMNKVKFIEFARCFSQVLLVGKMKSRTFNERSFDIIYTKVNLTHRILHYMIIKNMVTLEAAVVLDRWCSSRFIDSKTIRCFFAVHIRYLFTDS
jgi:hypothetical protein